MKLAFSLLIVALFSSAAFAAKNEAVQELILDEHSVYRIPVAIDRVTTVSFPGPIEALDGAALTMDGKAPAKFQIAYKSGNHFFSVRCLEKEEVTNLNVVWNNKTYVLELAQSSKPWLSVIFQRETDAVKAAGMSPITPTRLLGLLDKAKAYQLLKEHHPGAVESVQVSTPKNVMDYQDFEIVVEEAYRFDPQDTIVFRLLLRNKSNAEILYKPDGFSVRAGERVYYQSISDASGIMQPKSETPAYFAITGTPSGGRNDLSLKNQFTVIVNRLDPSVTSAVQNIPGITDQSSLSK